MPELPGVFANAADQTQHLEAVRVARPEDLPDLTVAEKLDQEPFKVIDTDGKHWRVYAYAVEPVTDLATGYERFDFYAAKDSTAPEFTVTGRMVPGHRIDRVFTTR